MIDSLDDLEQWNRLIIQLSEMNKSLERISEMLYKISTGDKSL